MGHEERNELDWSNIFRDGPLDTRLRAADIVIGHTAKAIEIEDVEVRVAALEVAANVGQR